MTDADRASVVSATATLAPLAPIAWVAEGCGALLAAARGEDSLDRETLVKVVNWSLRWVRAGRDAREFYLWALSDPAYTWVAQRGVASLLCMTPTTEQTRAVLSRIYVEFSGSEPRTPLTADWR